MENRETLKGYFNTGDRPGEQEFADLIEKTVNIIDDKATVLEAEEGTNDIKFVTPLGVKESILHNVPSASQTVKGLIEIATIAEIEIGTDTLRAVTSAGAKASVIKWAPVKTVNGVIPNTTTGDVALGLEDTGWQTISTFSNSTSALDAVNSVRYRRKNGVVFLDGKIKGGTAQDGTTTGLALFTLPSGYRPARKTSFTVIKADSSSIFNVGRIDIDSTGTVYGVLYSTVWNNLSDISFLI
ncbi:hypothetical protein GR160_13935 [Flavobacterium sp. Sd200]|uniref:hypothetical protein n=1 Tax=Flavobacterium sp. Sd200 TaxID=2692211 RepID=UPI00136C38F4|nr:hypothetical protein [Flavobacterium sp. Sd200]MXN92324.1 hypothetical protein [Flavobacterium sp. Sd200]